MVDVVAAVIQNEEGKILIAQRNLKKAQGGLWEFNYPEKDINLIAIECKIIKGDIKLNEHEDIKWVNKNELRDFNFAPADSFILQAILR